MSGIQDYWEFKDDFIGAGLFGAASAYDPWVATLTGTTPTATRMDHGETAGVFRPGVAQLLMAGTDANNACLSFGDNLSIDINLLRYFECCLRFVAGAAGTKNAATTVAWGITGDRNDAIDSIARAAIFRLASTGTDNALVIENTDGTDAHDDVATGLVMADSVWWKFGIDFSNLSCLRYFAGVDGGDFVEVAQSTVMKMNSYAAGVQPFFQIQKTAATDADRLQIDYVRLCGVRR